MKDASLSFGDGRDWFTEARYGLFIHWGLYAIPGWHEQHIYRKRLTRAEYAPLMRKFNPVRFDPDRWLDIAEMSGMRYVCFTAKHIDGFCMWDTDLTDFKSTNTPYGKDIVGMLAEACHRRGFPLCLYYSVVDNNQPNYPHAGRSYEFDGPQPGDQPDLERYLEFLKGQVAELCTRYGRIHGFWWDGNVLGVKDPSINAAIREMQPGIVINDRGMDDGDFGTPERDWGESVTSRPRFAKPVEACQSIGYQSWGWRRDEDYYSDAHLIGGIQNMLAKGGNYLLNVGPKPDGAFPASAVGRLTRIGRWLDLVRQSFDGTTPANELIDDHAVLLTRRGNILYVHIHKQPIIDAIYLNPIATLPVKATLLNTGRPIKVDIADLPWLHKSASSMCLRIPRLPVNSKNLTGWVVRLDFDDLERVMNNARPLLYF